MGEPYAGRLARTDLGGDIAVRFVLSLVWYEPTQTSVKMAVYI